MLIMFVMSVIRRTEGCKMSLYQRVRPEDFDEFVGNKECVTTLKSLFDKEERPHSYIFSGPYGCGKTTMARIIAKRIGADGFSLREYNTSNTRGIDTIREIVEQVEYKPMDGRNILFIIDEAHGLTNDAQQALLKTLEETPSYVYFILCTTEPNKLIKGIHTRCAHFTFYPLNHEELYMMLRKIKKQENYNVSGEVLDLITSKSDGVPRTALVILETISGIEDKKDQIQYIKDIVSTEDSIEVINLCRDIYNGADWNKISHDLRILENKKEDVEKIRRAVLGYLARTVIGKKDFNTFKKIEIFKEPLFYSGFPGLVYYCMKACNINKY